MLELKKTHLNLLEALTEEKHDIENYLEYDSELDDSAVKEEIVDLIKEYAPIPFGYNIDERSGAIIPIIDQENPSFSFLICEEDGPIIRISIKGLWMLHLHKKGLVTIVDDTVAYKI